MAKTWHLVVHGVVQGVFYRRTVCAHAAALDVHGTVQNLQDDTVEIYAQGVEEAVEEFIRLIEEEAGAADVHHIDVETLNHKKTYRTFEIKY